MSEMVERVASALWHNKLQQMQTPPILWNDAGPKRQASCREEARAAIAAMREPTREMEAGIKGNSLREDWWPAFAEHYRQMIDAAMETSKKAD